MKDDEDKKVVGSIDDPNYATFRRLRDEIAELEETTERQRRELEENLNELDKRYHLIKPFEDYYGVKKSIFDINLNLLGKR